MQGGRQELTRKDVVTTQLETAIKLFFEQRDMVSAHTLASAADEILEDLFEHRKEEILKRRGDKGKEGIYTSWENLFELYVKPEYRSEWFKKMRDPQNFFKHAEKDPDRILEFSGIKFVETKLFKAVTNYCLVFDEMPMPLSLFFTYFISRHPNIVIEGVEIDEIFVGITKEQSADLLNFSDPVARDVFYFGLEKRCPHLFKTPSPLKPVL